MSKREMDLAKALEKLASELPETISEDDVRVHEWLRRIVLASDDIANRISRRGLHWAKSR